MKTPRKGDVIEAGIKVGDTIHRKVCQVEIIRCQPDGTVRLSGRVKTKLGRWDTHPRMLREPWVILEPGGAR